MSITLTFDGAWAWMKRLWVNSRVPLMMAWFWIKNIALSLDQLLNAILFGDPDETLSRRAGRACDESKAGQEAARGWGCLLCGLLSWFDERHCKKAVDRLAVIEGDNGVWGMTRRWRAKHSI